jgi:hypothetical protein
MLYAQLYLSIVLCSVCVFVAPDPIIIAINKVYRCIMAITPRCPLVYPRLEISLTDMSRYLVPYNINTGEVVNKFFRRGIYRVVYIIPLKIVI